MIDFIIKYWIEVLFSAIIGIIGYIVKQLKEHKNKERNIEQALLAITKDRLYQGCKFFLSKDEIDIQELDNINMLFDTYTKLGGNHGMEAIVNRVRSLKVVE